MIGVGQGVEVRNSDPFAHNVHMFPTKAREFNRAQQSGKPFTQKFRKAEPQPFKIKCDIHPWMSAYAGVFDHPYFAVSKPDGTFELPKISPGTYTVTAWHEKLEIKTQTVTIGDGETQELSFEF